MRPKPIAALAVVASGCAAAGAAASPPWSAPRDVSATFPAVSQPSIGFGSDGTALLSWSEHLEAAATPAERSRVVSLRSDGTVVNGGTVSGALPAPPQVYGRNRTVVLRARRRTTGTGRTRVRLDAAFGTTARPLGSRVRRVADFQAVGDWPGPAMAVGRRGEVAVAWTEIHRGPRQDEFEGEHRVKLAFGRAGRGFGRPRTVAAFPYLYADSQAVALAYGARGDLVVAYAIGRLAVAARVRRAGQSFGRRQVLGTRLETTSLAAAVAPDGRVVVVWGSQDGGEEANEPWVVRAAIRPAGRRFGRAVVLDAGDTLARVPRTVAVAAAPDGSATAAWGNARGPASSPQFPVRTATASASGGFGAVTQLADTGVLGSVAAAADGTTLVTWTNAAPGFELPRPELGDVLAALRAPGAPAPGTPETVSSAELDDIAPAAAAFDPRTGRPTVIWPAGHRNISSFTGPIDADRLQLATRSG